jgi:hypothetical protein
VKNDDFFNSFMFGKRNVKPVSHQEPNFSMATLEKYLEHVNVDEFADKIDVLLSTAKQLKPYINQLSPLFKQMINRD